MITRDVAQANFETACEAFQDCGWMLDNRSGRSAYFVFFERDALAPLYKSTRRMQARARVTIEDDGRIRFKLLHRWTTNFLYRTRFRRAVLRAEKGMRR